MIETEPRYQQSTAAHPRWGLHLLRRVRQSVGVQVRFIIHEADVTQRRAVMQRILAWAEAGGILTTGDRPGQQLHVAWASLPGMSALTWLDELTLEFQACQPPYWQAITETTVTTSGQAELMLPGTAPESCLSARVVNEGDAPLTTLTLRSGSTAMTFEGFNLPAGGEFLLTLQDTVLTAAIGGVSVLMCRTPDSDDLLLAPCGQACEVAVSADQPVSATFSARGWYL